MSEPAALDDRAAVGPAGTSHAERPRAAARPARPAAGGTLVGTGVLVRHVLRLDRVRLPVWIGAIVALVLFSAISIMDLYPTPEDAAAYARLMRDNPTFTAIGGPGLGLDDRPDPGAVLVNETTLWVALACAVMSVLLVTRHTRSEEESERLDLVRSTVVGRHAPSVAALVVVCGANLAIGLLSWVAVVAAGFDPVGSVAFAASFAACGIVFTGIGAVAAQLTSSGRATIGLSLAVLGTAYVVRMAGDLGDGTLSWLSPLGWTHQLRAYAGERWWVLGLSVVAAAGSFVVAAVLSEHRDLGAGMLPQRLGRARAAATLTPRGGLAFRLQRGQLAGWSIGLALLGAVYGSVGQDVEQMFEDNPELQDFVDLSGEAPLVDSFVSYTLLLGAMLAAGYAVSSVLRMRTEERTGRADLLLGGPLPRPAWMASQLWVTVVGTALLLAASGLGTGVGLAVALDEPGRVLSSVGASAAHLPAVLVVVGAAVALWGLRPAWSSAAWAVVALVVAVGLFGDLLRLPGWVRRISPLEHSPGMPAEPFDALPLAVLVLVAAALLAAGVAGFARRDVAAT